MVTEAKDHPSVSDLLADDREFIKNLHRFHENVLCRKRVHQVSVPLNALPLVKLILSLFPSHSADNHLQRLAVEPLLQSLQRDKVEAQKNLP